MILSLFLLLILTTSFSENMNVTAQSNSLTIWVSVGDRYSQAVTGLLDKTGVTLNIITISQDKFENEMLNAALNGSLPDAVIANSMYIPTLVNMKAIKSLKSERDSRFYPSVERTVAYYNVTKDEVLVEDKIQFYGIPFIANTEVLYVNTLRWNKEINSLDDLYKAALYSNDQTNPADKYYGFSFTDLPDPAMALFYGSGATIFKDGYIDVTHLQITAEPQKQALYKMYEMTKLRRLTPDWDEQGTKKTRDLFTNQGRVALVIDDAGMIDAAKKGSVFGEDLNHLEIMLVPGNGAPVRSIALMPTYTDSKEKLDLIKDLGEKLLSKNLQKSLFDNYQLLPVVKDILSNSDGSESVFDMALQHAYQLPINIKWRLVEKVFTTEIEKMLRGDQDQNRTAVSIDVQLRPNLPLNQPYKPIPVFAEATATSKGSGGFLSFNGIFVVAIVSILFIDLLIFKRRRS